ncbi:CTP synthase [Sesbania bispinosa]|nr:CTP synthase [Sesbania bispinosa]
MSEQLKGEENLQSWDSSALAIWRTEARLEAVGHGWKWNDAVGNDKERLETSEVAGTTRLGEAGTTGRDRSSRTATNNKGRPREKGRRKGFDAAGACFSLVSN